MKYVLSYLIFHYNEGIKMVGILCKASRSSVCVYAELATGPFVQDSLAWYGVYGGWGAGRRAGGTG